MLGGRLIDKEAWDERRPSRSGWPSKAEPLASIAERARP